MSNAGDNFGKFYHHENPAVVGKILAHLASTGPPAGSGPTAPFRAAADGVSVAAEKTNWILYEFDWAN